MHPRISTRKEPGRPVVALVLVLGGSIAGWSAACARPNVLPPEPSPLPPVTETAAPLALRVTGIVFDRWGYAVPDASITVRVGSPIGSPGADATCPDASHLPTRTRSSPIGRFEVIVEAGRRAPFEACIEVEALPPPGTPWRENVAVLPAVRFAPVDAGGRPAHGVEVRVMLY